MKTLMFCAAICVVIGSSGNSTLARQAPQTGTLVIKVPRGFLPSDDFWVYVNGKMISAPPHAAFPTLNREFMHVSNDDAAAPRDSWRDADGRAAFSEGGKFTFLRAGIRERLFEDVTLSQKAAGRYRVELMTRSANKPFPFAIARSETRLAAGASQTVELVLPYQTDEMYVVQASRCGTCSISSHPPTQTLEFILHDLNKAIEALDKNPIVAALDEILLNLSVTPGRNPTVSAALPLAMGGGRELDARQMSLVLDALRAGYEFDTIDQNKSLQNAEAPTPQLAEALSLRIKKYNARIQNFQKIITALEQARR